MTGELLFCTSAAASLLIGLGAVVLLLGFFAMWATTERRRDKGSRGE